MCLHMCMRPGVHVVSTRTLGARSLGPRHRVTDDNGRLAAERTGMEHDGVCACLFICVCVCVALPPREMWGWNLAHREFKGVKPKPCAHPTRADTSLSFSSLGAFGHACLPKIKWKRKNEGKGEKKGIGIHITLVLMMIYALPNAIIVLLLAAVKNKAKRLFRRDMEINLVC